MQKAIQKTHDKNYARRLMAILMLHRATSLAMLAECSAVAVPSSDAELIGSRCRVLQD
ncbi:putative transposase [Escherichia coli 2-210-07_S4_C2]|nr:putative transposase [Escherichia coli 2-156-04_S4_C3]KDX59102.1 putative transposase [Escherichia coli 2-210-07_S4_C2]KDX64643.1 putative transposase [Escherichia coli 2-210-07_S4_C3]KEM90693.1 putative transposase [Escherichia coli 2-222-05_S4_C1]